MIGPQLLRIVQTDVKGFDIASNYSWNGNVTPSWEQASIQFGPPDPSYGIIIASPSLSGGEFGEAPIEGTLYIALDNITLTYALPCNFDALNIPENLQISHQPYLDIPLGIVTYVDFIGSSQICSNGPFVYTLENSK